MQEEPSPQEAKPGEEGDDNSDKGDQSSPSVAAAADDISRPQSKRKVHCWVGQNSR